MITFGINNDAVIADDLQTAKVINYLAEENPMCGYSADSKRYYHEIDLPLKRGLVSLVRDRGGILVTGDDAAWVRSKLSPDGIPLYSGTEFIAEGWEEKWMEFFNSIFKKPLVSATKQALREIKFKKWLKTQIDYLFTVEYFTPTKVTNTPVSKIRVEIDAIVLKVK